MIAILMLLFEFICAFSLLRSVFRNEEPWKRIWAETIYLFGILCSFACFLGIRLENPNHVREDIIIYTGIAPCVLALIAVLFIELMKFTFTKDSKTID